MFALCGKYFTKIKLKDFSIYLQAKISRSSLEVKFEGFLFGSGEGGHSFWQVMFWALREWERVFNLKQFLIFGSN